MAKLFGELRERYQDRPGGCRKENILTHGLTPCGFHCSATYKCTMVSTKNHWKSRDPSRGLTAPGLPAIIHRDRVPAGCTAVPNPGCRGGTV